MNLPDVLRRAISDRELGLEPSFPSEITAEEMSRLRNWFRSAHRRNELDLPEELNRKQLLELALWCHVDAQTLSDMPPEIRRRDLAVASDKFHVDMRALPTLITSTASLFDRPAA